VSAYQTLSAVNVNEHKAQKGGFDYLSWADAVDVLQQHYPEATWEVREWDGLPFIVAPTGTWVCVTVVIDGIARTQWHPVLDHRNKTIPAENLDAFAINTSIQRALAKAIALHGLGLYIFRGEDFPDAAEAQVATVTNDQLGVLRDMMASTDTDEAAFCKFLRVAQLEDLFEANYSKAMSALNAKAKKLAEGAA
jgi:hypothetical protein